MKNFNDFATKIMGLNQSVLRILTVHSHVSGVSLYIWLENEIFISNFLTFKFIWESFLFSLSYEQYRPIGKIHHNAKMNFAKRSNFAQLSEESKFSYLSLFQFPYFQILLIMTHTLSHKEIIDSIWSAGRSKTNENFAAFWHFFT